MFASSCAHTLVAKQTRNEQGFWGYKWTTPSWGKDTWGLLGQWMHWILFCIFSKVERDRRY